MVLATVDHAKYIAPLLRDADREEIKALTGKDVEPVLIESVLSTGEHWAALMEGKPICLLGISELSLMGSNDGVIWMVGTDDIMLHRKKILSMSKSYIDVKREMFRLLFNYVDVRNTSSIRWLKWLGFEVHNEKPYGHLGLKFHRFELRS